MLTSPGSLLCCSHISPDWLCRYRNPSAGLRGRLARGVDDGRLDCQGAAKVATHQVSRVEIVAALEQVEDLQMLGALSNDPGWIDLQPMLDQAPELVCALEGLEEHRVMRHADEILVEDNARLG